MVLLYRVFLVPINSIFVKLFFKEQLITMHFIFMVEVLIDTKRKINKRIQHREEEKKNPTKSKAKSQYGSGQLPLYCFIRNIQAGILWQKRQNYL